MNDHLQAIQTAVIHRHNKEIAGLVQAALDGGLNPHDIINDGLIPAMETVGAQFGRGEIFVPEMLVSAMTMKIGLDRVKPLLKGDQSLSRGTVLMGTVKGDLHDIGKNIVLMMLEGAGFKVVDLGVDLTVEKVLDQVKEHKPDILGLSALLTTTMPEMKNVIDRLAEAGLKGQVKVMIGGAPVDATFAAKIGADGYGANAAEAVDLAKRLVGR